MSIPLVLRALGSAGCGALAVVGFLTHPTAALGGVAIAVFVGGGVALHLQQRAAAGHAVAGGRRVAIAAGGSALWGWLAGAGLMVLLGPSVQSFLIAALLVGVPTAVRLRGLLRPAEPRPLDVPLPDAVPFPVPATLSTSELCLAWRRSYLTLVELPAGVARGELVAVRQSMLDELERRDSHGFHRWLDDGARAGGDPARYLATGPGV